MKVKIKLEPQFREKRKKSGFEATTPGLPELPLPLENQVVIAFQRENSLKSMQETVFQSQVVQQMLTRFPATAMTPKWFRVAINAIVKARVHTLRTGDEYDF